jgi:hypothetical protein
LVNWQLSVVVCSAGYPSTRASVPEVQKGQELVSVKGVWLSWRLLACLWSRWVSTSCCRSVHSAHTSVVRGFRFVCCDAVLMGELFPMFRRMAVPSSGSSSSLKIMHRHPYTRREPMTQRYGVTAHKDLNRQQHRCKHLPIWSCCKPF